MFMVYKCVMCDVPSSPDWWKCCNKHVTMFGTDLICEGCLYLHHNEKEIESAKKVL